MTPRAPWQHPGKQAWESGAKVLGLFTKLTATQGKRIFSGKALDPQLLCNFFSSLEILMISKPYFYSVYVCRTCDQSDGD